MRYTIFSFGRLAILKVVCIVGGDKYLTHWYCGILSSPPQIFHHSWRETIFVVFITPHATQMVDIISTYLISGENIYDTMCTMIPHLKIQILSVNFFQFFYKQKKEKTAM
jgi:hypothetical protein